MTTKIDDFQFDENYIVPGIRRRPSPNPAPSVWPGWYRFLVLLVCCFAQGWCASKLYQEISQRSIAAELADHSKPISNIVFPAITICPENKANITEINFTAMYRALRDQAIKQTIIDSDDELKMKAMLQMCDAHLGNKLQLSTSQVSYQELMNYLNQIAPKLEATISQCQHPAGQCSPQQFFSRVWTEEGLCFTYNSLNSADLYRNSSMLAQHFPLTNHDRPVGADYPFRAQSAGHFGRFNAVMKQLMNNTDYICRGAALGFKVAVHSPDEVPFVSRHYFRLSMGVETLVTVQPRVTEAQPELQRHSIERRQCYFDDDEHKLRFFNTYTQRNCEMECLSGYFLKVCNCTRFSMPHGDNDTVCGHGQLQCMSDAEKQLLKSNNCDCLPPCSGVQYDLEVSHAQYSWKEMHDAYGEPYDKGLWMSRLNVMFKESQYTPVIRRDRYGTVEVLALLGGLIAIFSGVTMLNFADSLYAVLHIVWRKLF